MIDVDIGLDHVVEMVVIVTTLSAKMIDNTIGDGAKLLPVGLVVNEISAPRFDIVAAKFRCRCLFGKRQS